VARLHVVVQARRNVHVAGGIRPGPAQELAPVAGSRLVGADLRPCSTLKTEVAKVFMTMEITHELVDPNPKDYEK
jgi:hypothetical protein